MAVSPSVPKAACHARSNSLPARSHPIASSFEGHLCRLRTSEASSSSSASSLIDQLGCLKGLHEQLQDLIQLPSTQRTLSYEKSGADKVLNGSLRLLDVCGTARDVFLQTKESIQELESSLRRKRGQTSLSHDVGTYLKSRKTVIKKVSKCINDLKSSEKHCPSVLIDEDSDLVAILEMLREVEIVSFSVLKSALSYMSGTKSISKQISWSFATKFMQPKRISSDAEGKTNEHEVKKIDGALYALTIQKSCEGTRTEAVQDLQKQLQTFERVIQELEEGLEPIFSCLLKTRVSLLNVLSQ
ncbi:hypothetical protein RJ640_020746 [Escallonia rubra]|uniref:DUF241 domain protein n=1 Tax=Escallonia rubra TaxID=112253 RepID=A0AA88S318_9ASTE|nr:hypothetical protein RJ640_020746 [Escallonia rubra]